MRCRILTVCLEKDYKDEDLDGIVSAIQRLRGVAGVTTNEVDHATYGAEMHVRMELRQKLIDVLWPKK
jgi:hypothetical protein